MYRVEFESIFRELLRFGASVSRAKNGSEKERDVTRSVGHLASRKALTQTGFGSAIHKTLALADFEADCLILFFYTLVVISKQFLSLNLIYVSYVF